CALPIWIGMPSFVSISSSVRTFVSKYSSKNAIPTPIINPRTIAMAILSIGFGSTGDGSALVTASVNMLTLSTFIISGMRSWNTWTVVLAISVARFGSGSFTETVTTCESCSLETWIFDANVSGEYDKSSSSITSVNMAALVMMTLYVLISSTFVLIVPESICISELCSGWVWFTMNCVLD